MTKESSEGCVRVPVPVLRRFVAQLFVAAGNPAEDAERQADVVVGTDLNGVQSHGTKRLPSYLNLLTAGRMNPSPDIRVVQESPTTAVIDGDGGLGHLPSLLAAQMATAKAREMGLGAVTTRNHNHFGAAGAYSRVPADSGCIGFAVSSNTFNFLPGERYVTDAGGGSPMSFAFPKGQAPPFVLDMSIRMFRSTEELLELLPNAAFKSLGLGMVCAGLGNLMAGVQDIGQTRDDLWPASNQGAFVLAINVRHFIPLEVFQRDLDEFVRQAQQMKPLPGFDRADLPGNLEWEQEHEWRKAGIPFTPDHQKVLEDAAAKLGVPSPFQP